MDKFGVFNLINSLLSLYRTQNTVSSPANDPEKKETSQHPSDVSPQGEERRINDLGDRLLKISASHDEFVKRVKKSQKKTP
ncbi:MAG: hypothetical protein J5697_03510 [Clostridia bacterium]|nr:hypothetical protein [Clostridia bacterium]